MFTLKIASLQILLNTVEVKKRGIREIDRFRKKIMIPDYEIPKCREHEVKSKIETIFVNEKILEEYLAKSYEIDPYFYEHCKEKIQTDKISVSTYYLELMFILLNIF